MKDAAQQPMAAPGQLLLQHQLVPPPRRCLKKSASAATFLGGGSVAANRYLLQEELGRGASGQVSIGEMSLEKRKKNKPVLDIGGGERIRSLSVCETPRPIY